jgi:hypothetical protein
MPKKPKQPRLRCFLSSPFLVDTGSVRRVLQDLNVETTSIDDFPPAGQTPVEAVSAQIRRASFVLSVITGDRNAAVLFELGLAMGLGKPVFLVADDKDHLAASLLSLPFVVTSLNDVETLRFHMEAFLASLALPRKTSTVSKRRPRFYGGGEPVPIQRTDSSPEAYRVAFRLFAVPDRPAIGCPPPSPTCPPWSTVGRVA